MSVFDKYEKEAWPIEFHGHLHVPCIVGGIPNDQNVATGWIRSKFAEKDDLIAERVAEVMLERGIDDQAAIDAVAREQHVNGFKRSSLAVESGGGLYVEGRQLKAAVKEMVSVCVASGKIPARGWGRTNKGALGFVAEHVVVVEDRLPLGAAEPTGVMQRFVHTHRGNAIQYEEYVEGAEIDFTVRTDWHLTERDWGVMWLTGQEQGLGASRSQGFGRYEVTEWTKVRDDRKKPAEVEASADGRALAAA